MLVDINRRLQLSSATIKASVSSLLDYEIFWDEANQHEFLETIDSCIDQLGDIINLLALMFRLEAGRLDLRRESQSLTEILSAVQEHLSHRKNGLNLEISLPPDGKPVLVHFEYTIIAIELLLEAASWNGVKEVRVETMEENDRWIVNFEGFEQQVIEFVKPMALKQDIATPLINDVLTPDVQLRLYLASHILRLQDIRIEVSDQAFEAKHLILSIPAQINK